MCLSCSEQSIDVVVRICHRSKTSSEDEKNNQMKIAQERMTSDDKCSQRNEGPFDGSRSKGQRDEKLIARTDRADGNLESRPLCKRRRSTMCLSCSEQSIDAVVRIYHRSKTSSEDERNNQMKIAQERTTSDEKWSQRNENPFDGSRSKWQRDETLLQRQTKQTAGSSPAPCGSAEGPECA